MRIHFLPGHLMDSVAPSICGRAKPDIAARCNKPGFLQNFKQTFSHKVSQGFTRIRKFETMRLENQNIGHRALQGMAPCGHRASKRPLPIFGQAQLL